ncbi:MAG: nicotinate-nicotinamide nucleotide adenylyltransferase [Ehrlichia sp.]
MEDRLILSKELTFGCRKVNVVRIEECYSYNVVIHLRKKFKNVKFIWLMGSDNLFSFHYWYRWKDFCKLLPIVVFERDKCIYKSLNTPFVSYMRNMYFKKVQLLLNYQCGWNFIRLKPCNISSSKVRGYSLNKM